MTTHTFSDFKIKYGEFPDLLFTVSNDETEYCDVTDFMEKRKCADTHSVEGFMKVCKPWINAFCNVYSLDMSNLTVTAPNNHILIDSSLALLFVSYIDTEFCVYVYEKMADLLVSGIILSDTTLMLMVKDRLPKEVLLNLIDKYE